MPVFYLNNEHHFPSNAVTPLAAMGGTALLNPGFTQPLLVTLLARSCTATVVARKESLAALTILPYKLLLSELATRAYAPVSGISRYSFIRKSGVVGVDTCDDGASDLNSGKVQFGGLTPAVEGSELSNDLWFCAFGAFNAPSRCIEPYRYGSGARCSTVGVIGGFNYARVVTWPTT